ncbi:FkbM family methyltransferase [Cyanobacterium aponinum AL20118]|uniref:FkbM family methyltransferase n=1 Tax=Cyanobacterium aponinum AL20115 TaxID=3090662 RepID=A0AAF0ZJV6_9CHRO|nr:FkbM family methyltransferase [Cyanobacterium aponinum]WPF89672.1 FkbM family methyltransferase [Cyanobacterium aponinum AL20115]
MMYSEILKQKLLTTFLGEKLLKIRNFYELWECSWKNPENLPTLVNDQISSTILTKLCEKDKVFIDVGSHIGSIISAVKSYNSQIEIIGIEAIPEKVIKLRKAFPFVEIYECAVGDREGEVCFYINTLKSGYSSLGRKKDPRNQEEMKEIKVQLKTLDNLIPSDKKVGVIKIDTEGAELGVLRGAVNLISRNRPLIMFESGPNNNDLGYTKEDMWLFFENINYQLIIPNRLAHNGDSLTLEGFIESHLYPRRTTNYFAIPSEKRELVKKLARNIMNVQV